jgi:hypothetical protein
MKQETLRDKDTYTTMGEEGVMEFASKNTEKLENWTPGHAEDALEPPIAEDSEAVMSTDEAGGRPSWMGSV